MNEKIAKRIFKVWEYRVSHQQLLIRSPKSDDVNHNIDLIFGGVRLMDVNTHLGEIRFGDNKKEDFQDLDPQWFEDDSPYNLYILESANRRNRIVAAGIKIIENDLELFKSSLEDFSD